MSELLRFGTHISELQHDHLNIVQSLFPFYLFILILISCLSWGFFVLFDPFQRNTLLWVVRYKQGL